MSEVPVCKRCDEKGIWLKATGAMEFDASTEVIAIRFSGWFCPKCMAFLCLPKRRKHTYTRLSYEQDT